MNADDAPKIQVDSDWKAEAQAEKDRLAAKEQSKKAAGSATDDPGSARQAAGYPEPSFRALVGLLASQALMGLGTMQDPETKGIVVDLEAARFSIDLLAILEEKTKGNLEDEDAAELTQLIVELRSRFVQMTQLIAQQAAAGDLNPTDPSGIQMP